MSEFATGKQPPRKLKILHVATHTGIAGGGAVAMLNMATGLKARGHEVFCAFHRREDRRGPGEGNFESLDELGLPYQTYHMEAALSVLLGDQRRFRAFIKKHAIDIVHCHKPRALRFALKSLKSTPGPAIIAQRGNSYELDAVDRVFYGDPRVRAVVCVAEQLREIAIAGGLDARKIFTNYNGVDPAQFDFTLDPQPIRRELGLPDEAPVVGIIANFDGKKNYAEFFKATALLLQRRPDARVLVVGRGAPDDLPQQLRELGIEKNVLLAGFRADVPRMLAAMDVSVNFSKRGEGLTGAMRESLCMKTPVVCTDIGGNRELVRDGETGRLVPSMDHQAFVAAIIDLLDHPERARQMAENGYCLVLEKFTKAKSIENLERIYYHALNEETY